MERADLATLRTVCSQPYGFWLDSAMATGRLGSRSLWGADPNVMFRCWGRRVQVDCRQRASERFQAAAAYPPPAGTLRRGRQQGGQAANPALT